MATRKTATRKRPLRKNEVYRKAQKDTNKRRRPACKKK